MRAFGGMRDYQREGYSRYGAWMGRESNLDTLTTATLTIHQVPLDASGYDPGGAYWGAPYDLYHVTDGSSVRYLRAPSRVDAMKQFPNAVWSTDTEVSDDDIEDMLTGYVEAALWSTTDENDEPLDVHYSAADIDPATLAMMRADCAAFARGNAAVLLGAAAAWSKVGNDFWYTRNGHVCGFDDGDWDEAGDALAEACRGREVYLVVNNKGRIVQS